MINSQSTAGGIRIQNQLVEAGCGNNQITIGIRIRIFVRFCENSEKRIKLDCDLKKKNPRSLMELFCYGKAQTRYTG